MLFRSGIQFASSNGTSVPLAGYANIGDHTIHLDDINVTGGSVRLTGQILSTGNGRVVALNGQPSLEIKNDSDWNLALGAINLGAVSGTINITNTPRINLVPTGLNSIFNALTFDTPTGLKTGDKVRPSYDDGIVQDSFGNYVSTTDSPIPGLSRDAIYSIEQLGDDRTLRLLDVDGKIGRAHV